MAKRKKANETKSQPRFEDALAELQQIVDELEDGSLGLEDSMQRFETGIALLRSCYQILDSAEQKIELLTGLDADGNPITAPFDATASAEQSEQTAGKRKQRSSRSRTSKSEADEETSGDESEDRDSLF